MTLRKLTMFLLGVAVATAIVVGIHTKDISDLQNQVRQLRSQVATMQAQAPSGNGGGAPAASAQTTSAGPVTIHAPLTLQWPVASLGNRFLVCDNTPGCAPMFWVNGKGTFSLGDGGRMPGGLTCVMYNLTSYPACMTPEGTLTLQATGPGGPTGPVVTLTPQAVQWLLKAMHIRPRW